MIKKEYMSSIVKNAKNEENIDFPIYAKQFKKIITTWDLTQVNLNQLKAHRLQKLINCVLNLITKNRLIKRLEKKLIVKSI